MPEEWKPDDTWFLWRVPPLESELTPVQRLFGVQALQVLVLKKPEKTASLGISLSMDGGWTIVSDIKKGGPAEAAGVRLGNRIHIIGDVTIRDGAHATRLMKEHADGDVKVGLTKGTPPHGSLDRLLMNYKNQASYLRMYSIPCGILNPIGGVLAWNVSSRVASLDTDADLIESTTYSLRMCKRIFCACAFSIALIYLIGAMLILQTFVFKSTTFIKDHPVVLIVLYVMGSTWQIVLIFFTIMFRAATKALTSDTTASARVNEAGFVSGSQFVW